MSPKEVDINYLNSLSNMFNVDINENFLNENRELSRIYVDNLPQLLKMKGTYSSIYATVNSMFGNTINTLKVFERWHPTFD